jgi:RimJ/RimL family protein N-acetyltransferase
VSWTFTADVDAYDRATGPVLRADPAKHTISLTIIETARARGYADALYGWWTGADGAVTGAVSHTPPFPLLLGVVPDIAMRPLVTQLLDIGRRPSGVGGPSALAAQFGAVWTSIAGGQATLHDALRLYRLGVLRAPSVVGRARPATEDDLELLVRWHAAFVGAIGQTPTESRVAVVDRLSFGGWMLWEDAAGVPVSMAGRSRPAAGVSRVAPVYTPAEHRRHGYAAGVTAAVSAAALQVADGVVLFTDLANPTSNALYQRLGYQPVTDRLTLHFTD